MKREAAQLGRNTFFLFLKSTVFCNCHPGDDTKIWLSEAVNCARCRH